MTTWGAVSKSSDSWSGVSKDTNTWSSVTKLESILLDSSPNFLGLQTIGHLSLEGTQDGAGMESTTEFTDAEHLLAIQALGHLMDYVDGFDSEWVAVSQVSTTWSQETVDSTFGSGLFGGGLFGGGIAASWAAVAKDTIS